MTEHHKYMRLFGDNRDEIDYNNINYDLLYSVADSILNKHQIIVPTQDGNQEFRICEIEFYVKNESHNDQYVHQDDHQLTYGKWYFHRTKTGNYKGGTYKGVDLTLGDADSNTYWGVLIRSVLAPNDEFIEGPCRTVNKILELNNCKDVNEYMQNRNDPPNARSTHNFHIKRCQGLEKHLIHVGPRIGLSNKYLEYRPLPYRFAILSNRNRKEAKKLQRPSLYKNYNII